MARTGWLAVVALAALATGLAVRLAWPGAAPALDCAPGELRFDGGVAFCAGGAPPGAVPAGPGLTLGVKLDLNRASAEELGILPGIGPSLAATLVKGREELGGAFHDWDEVDALPGVGPAKLDVLRSSAEIR